MVVVIRIPEAQANVQFGSAHGVQQWMPAIETLHFDRRPVF